MITDVFIMLSVLFVSMMSPGPDMMLIMRYSLSDRPKSALYCVFGVLAGLMVHIALAVAGVAALLASGGLAFKIAKFIGAAYLVYIGYKMFTAKGASLTAREEANATYARAFREGALTNMLNPKVMIFILALFTQIFDPSDTVQKTALMISIMLAAVFVIWYGFALIIRQPLIISRLQKYEVHLNKGFGGALIAFGLILVYT